MSMARWLWPTLPAAAVITAIAGIAAWAFWWEPSSLRVTQHAVELSRWPSNCDDLRIAVLADLHVGSPYIGLDSLSEIVTATRAAQPDLVLLAGDYVSQGVVGGTFVAPEAAARVLHPLRQSAPVFAVLGNHDWWLDSDRVRHALQSVDIAVLDDASTTLRLGACTLSLVGVSDFWEGPHDVDRALAGVADSDTTVLFTHNPDLFDAVPDHVELTIAGHTHGGQVYIPGLGRPIVPSAFGERFAAGHIVEHGRHLFVSTGIGTSIIPIRFLVAPEVSVLRIRHTRTGGPRSQS